MSRQVVSLGRRWCGAWCLLAIVVVFAAKGAVVVVVVVAVVAVVVVLTRTSLVADVVGGCVCA